MTLRHAVATITLLLATSPAWAADQRLAVLELTGPSIGEDIRRALTDRVRASALEPARRSAFSVMTRESTALVMEQMGAGCIDGQCEIEIARTIGAAAVVTGEVRKLEGAFLCDLKLHDTQKGSLLAVEPVRAADLLTLLDGTATATARLVSAGLARAVGSEGTIDLDVVDAGARVLVDGTEVARGPARKTLVTPVGTHRVVVDLAGHATWESSVNVLPRNLTVVAPRLVPLSGGDRPVPPRDRRTYLDGTGAFMVGGPAGVLGYDVRVGRWFWPEWALELAFAQAVDDQSGLAAQSTTGGLGGGWSPHAARWFSIGAGLAFTWTDWTYASQGQPSGGFVIPSFTGSSMSISASAEARADVRLLWGVHLAARLGLIGAVTAFNDLTREKLATVAAESPDVRTGASSVGPYVRAGLRLAF